MFRRGPVLLRDAEGKGGGGGDPAPANDPPANDPPAPTNDDPPASPGGILDDARQRRAAEGEVDPPAPPPAGDGDPPARPDTVPEQFWDAEKGELKADALIKSWNDTRQELKAAKAGGSAPEKADDYKFESPEGIARPIKDDDPALRLFKTIAHTAGLSQEQFNAIGSEFVKGLGDMLPELPSIEDEKKILGDNADAVANAVLGWGEGLVKRGTWSKDEFEEIIIMGSTGTGLKALNKLRELTGETAIPVPPPGEGGDAPSEEELYAMVNDPKYASDAAYRKKVDAAFQKHYGTAPAGTSVPGRGVGQSQGFAARPAPEKKAT